MVEEEKGITVKKSENLSEWYSQLVLKAELADIRYNVQGTLVHRPAVTKVIDILYKLWEVELDAHNHQKVIFPVMIPEENFLKEKEHVEGFAPEVFWVTEAGDNKLERKLALRPTSETAFYQMYSLWVRSWRDLPQKLYQSCAVYRNEPVTRPFLRGREFLWIESHCVFPIALAAVAQVEEDLEMAKKVFPKLGLPVMFLERPQWDKFAGADKTFAFDILMPDGKVLQISSTHLLGTHFTKTFDVSFLDEEGRHVTPHSSTFGIGIWRMVAAMLLTHGDDNGLVLPFELSPTQAVVIPIPGKGTVEKAERIYKELKAHGLRVHMDNSNYTPGFKYNQWELKGAAFRIEIGEREVADNSVTLASRLKKKQKVGDSNILEKIKEESQLMLSDLHARAEKFLKEHMHEAKDINGVKKALEKGGYVRVPFCSMEMDGKGCADKLQAETEGGKVRGTLRGSNDKATGTCVVCGEPATAVVYVAHQY